MLPVLGIAAACFLQSCGGGGGNGGSTSGNGNGSTGATGARRIDSAEFIVANAAGTVVGYAGAPSDTTGLPPDTSAFLNAILYSVATGTSFPHFDMDRRTRTTRSDRIGETSAPFRNQWSDANGSRAANGNPRTAIARSALHGGENPAATNEAARRTAAADA